MSGTGELVGDASGELLAPLLPEELRGWLPQSDETYILPSRVQLSNPERNRVMRPPFS